VGDLVVSLALDLPARRRDHTRLAFCSILRKRRLENREFGVKELAKLEGSARKEGWNFGDVEPERWQCFEEGSLGRLRNVLAGFDLYSFAESLLFWIVLLVIFEGHASPPIYSPACW